MNKFLTISSFIVVPGPARPAGGGAPSVPEPANGNRRPARAKTDGKPMVILIPDGGILKH